jgi:hypothetical protein
LRGRRNARTFTRAFAIRPDSAISLAAAGAATMVNVPLKQRNIQTAQLVNGLRLPFPRSTTIAIGCIAGMVLVIAGLFLWFGETIDRFHTRVAFDGRTMDRTPVHLFVAGRALTIPANMIRFAVERQSGATDRVDLLLHWPELDGFSEQNATVFRDIEPTAPLIFVTIIGRDADYGTTGWLDRIYTRYFSDDAWAGPDGLVGVRLAEDSGYAGEDLFFQPDAREPFVTRCTAAGNAEMPSTCMREILIGDTLIARYRFNKTLLGEWEKIDPAIRARVESLVRG